jgi:hypothetical protein
VPVAAEVAPTIAGTRVRSRTAPIDPTRTSIHGRPHCGHRVSSANRAVPQ